MRARHGQAPGLPDERGSAAVLAMVLGGLLVVLAVLLSAVTGVLADQRRVATAADLAALAGAAAAQRGEDGCQAADRTAARNGADVVGCRSVAGIVTVDVRRSARAATTRLLGRPVRVSSRARAGPVGSFQEVDWAPDG